MGPYSEMVYHGYTRIRGPYQGPMALIVSRAMLGCEPGGPWGSILDPFSLDFKVGPGRRSSS